MRLSIPEELIDRQAIKAEQQRLDGRPGKLAVWRPFYNPSLLMGALDPTHPYRSRYTH